MNSSYIDKIVTRINISTNKKITREQVVYEINTLKNNDNNTISQISNSNSKKIGQGNFGLVYQIDDKVVKINKIANKDNDLYSEAVIMSICKHDNVAEILGLKHLNVNIIYNTINKQVPIKGNRIGLIMNHYKNGSFISKLVNEQVNNKKKKDILSNKQKINILYGICNGMAHIHIKGFNHRDLAARNILLDNNNNAKITDFGLSRIDGATSYNNKNLGGIPVAWMARERILGKPYTNASDVWSFGILMSETFNKGKPPYSDEKNKWKHIRPFLQNSTIEQIRKKVPPPKNYIMEQIFNSCIQIETQKRPDFNKLKNMFHTIIKILNEKSIKGKTT